MENKIHVWNHQPAIVITSLPIDIPYDTPIMFETTNQILMPCSCWCFPDLSYGILPVKSSKWPSEMLRTDTPNVPNSYEFKTTQLHTHDLLVVKHL